MNVAMRIASVAASSGRVPGEPELTVLGVLSTLLGRKRLVGLAAGAGLLPLLLLVGTMKPLYTSEAVLELSFDRAEAATPTTVSRQMASLDPGALINGAAQRIASRANATRVARRIGLEKSPANQGGSALLMIAGAVRSAFGLSGPQPTAEERAIDELLRNVRVSYKAHLYLIGVAYNARDPHEAAQLANAFAIEYLRGERLKELTGQRGIAQSELLVASERLGVLHPRRKQIEARIERIDGEITGIANRP